MCAVNSFDVIDQQIIIIVEEKDQRQSPHSGVSDLFWRKKPAIENVNDDHWSPNGKNVTIFLLVKIILSVFRV